MTIIINIITMIIIIMIIIIFIIIIIIMVMSMIMIVMPAMSMIQSQKVNPTICQPSCRIFGVPHRKDHADNQRTSRVATYGVE